MIIEIDTFRKQLKDRLLSTTFPKLHPELGKSFQYVMSAGKLLRPLIVLCVKHDFTASMAESKEVEESLEVPLSLELLHVASLIHDDLPALDNDDFRRGQPSCHRQFSESTALLSGDLLIGLAIEWGNAAPLPDRIARLVVTELSHAWCELFDGQRRDLDQQSSFEEILEVHSRKSGALFGAACAIGGLLAEREDRAGALREIGCVLGVCFQILDDLKDRSLNPEIKGRPPGSDEKNNKMTASHPRVAEEALRYLENSRESIFRRLDAIGIREGGLTRKLIEEILRD